MYLPLNDRIFKVIAELAKIHNIEVYVVGGYVRDLLLEKKSKDIDILVVGDGIYFAEQVARVLDAKHFTIFKTYGTAQIKYRNYEIEFVGARKESYRFESRNPSIEQGTFEDDINRRDFTINAMAISLNSDNLGEVIDIHGGINDLKKKIIRTTGNSDIIFSDDPLRMLRAIRFASQLNFTIDEQTFEGIKKNAYRIEIITKERIVDELNKILLSTLPSYGFILLDESGLLSLILPEISKLKGVEKNEGKTHKDNFYHTLQVVDQLRSRTDKLWLLWAGLLHDVGKFQTKKFQPGVGWTFHGHEVVGAHLVERIFKRMKMPTQETMPYVKKLVMLHLRPISLVKEEVTDSAVRRLIFEAGDDLDDLLMLAEADITSKNEQKVRLYLKNFKLLREKIIDIEEKDKIRNFQPPVSGEEIMQWFNLSPCKTVGDLKNKIKDAILDGIIPNERKAAIEYLLKIAEELNLVADENKINWEK
ncbi:MAG: CCA tRNA nucleotidyltransferase [Bacteroidales bacterium]|nr:CCA tRNA nucleotidyltransferase [Bacteroidales bacterium]